MIPCKENLVYFENLNRNSNSYPLFPGEYADFGIIIILNSEAKIEARKNLLELMKIYKYEISRYDCGSTTKVYIPYEDKGNYYFGIILSVNYHKDRKREYLSITINASGWNK